jgi:hypothetical protein
MNERMIDMAIEANSQTGNEFDLNHKPLDAFLTKFSELIIQECVAKCAETQAEYLKHRKASDDFTDKNIYAEGEAASDVIKYKIKRLIGVK